MMQATALKTALSIVPDLRVYVIFGLPGAGKANCGQALKEGEDYEHLSLGDFLRKQVEDKSEIGIKYKKAILDGVELIPCQVTQEIVKNKLLEIVERQKNLLIDGFPRTMEQAKFLSSFTKELGITPRYVNLAVEPELAIKRLLTRESCDVCAHVFMIIPTKIPHICDVCGGPLSKRLTDNRETLLKRIELFNNTTKKVIDYYLGNEEVKMIDANKSLEGLVDEFLEFDKSW